MPYGQTDISQHAAAGSTLLESLHLPTQQQYLDWVKDLHPVAAGLLIACGLVYLLHGWKVFKILVLANAAVAGAIAGVLLANLAGRGDTYLPYVAGLGGAAIFAVVAWPLMKAAVGVMGGVAGGMIGAGLWIYIAKATGRASPLDYAWVGGLVGLITLGLLAFLIFRFVVTIFTSLQGSLMVVSGVLGLLLLWESLAAEMENALRSSIHLLPLAVGLPSIVGFVFQTSAATKKGKKKPGGG